MTEIPRQRVLGDLAERAREFDPRRPGADDHERQPGRALRCVLLAFGELEGREDATPNLQGVADALQARRKGRPPFATEVRVPGTGGDDEIVVGDRSLSSATTFAEEIDRPRFGEQNLDVPLVAKMRRMGDGDVAGVQGGGGHLVEQRLEQVMVASVDERHLDVGLGQLPRRVEPAEPSPHDHHAFARCLLAHRSPVRRVGTVIIPRRIAGRR